MLNVYTYLNAAYIIYGGIHIIPSFIANCLGWIIKDADTFMGRETQINVVAISNLEEAIIKECKFK